MSVTTYEPRVIVIGETLIWEKELADYLPSDGWALSYSFRGAGPGFDQAATYEDDIFQITVAATVTVNLLAGAYYWQALVTKGSEKHLVDEGEVKVKAGLAAVASNTAVDNRSPVKKILDAIDALIVGRVPQDVHMYMIGNRQLQHIPVEQLINLRKHYARLYSQELRRQKIKKGGSYLQSIHVRFDIP
jgi:hypothetical protein